MSNFCDFIFIHDIHSFITLTYLLTDSQSTNTTKSLIVVNKFLRVSWIICPCFSLTYFYLTSKFLKKSVA
uniref:Uncharacterized protein n=1 Tax=Rhizophora mucronata TaxID=61149 RepID=A0A2P2PBT9_RHIMU